MATNPRIQPITNENWNTYMPLTILTLKTIGDRNLGAITVKLTGCLGQLSSMNWKRMLAPQPKIGSAVHRGQSKLAAASAAL